MQTLSVGDRTKFERRGSVARLPEGHGRGARGCSSGYGPVAASLPLVPVRCLGAGVRAAVFPELRCPGVFPPPCVFLPAKTCGREGLLGHLCPRQNPSYRVKVLIQVACLNQFYPGLRVIDDPHLAPRGAHIPIDLVANKFAHACV